MTACSTESGTNRIIEAKVYPKQKSVQRNRTADRKGYPKQRSVQKIRTADRKGYPKRRSVQKIRTADRKGYPKQKSVQKNRAANRSLSRNRVPQNSRRSKLVSTCAYQCHWVRGSNLLKTRCRGLCPNSSHNGFKRQSEEEGQSENGKARRAEDKLFESIEIFIDKELVICISIALN